MTEGPSDPALDWVIVGGGIHGVHIALKLLQEAEVPPERLRIVDPAEDLLARWHATTEVTGMTYLRSPAVHHLGPEPNSLLRFAGKRRYRVPGLFAAPYNRPSLDLFNAHCDSLIESFRLADRHLRGRVLECAVEGGRVVLHLSGGARLQARRAVLALGSSEQPHWPAWAPREEERLQHVLAADFAGWPEDGPERIAVVGGGITAAQVAIRLAKQGHQVQLVSRHAVREHMFDSDPGWLGPKYMTGFHGTRDYAHRRSMIVEARHRGSIPPDVRKSLRLREESGAIVSHTADVDDVVSLEDGVRVRLSSGSSLDVDRVLLATGFTPARPGGPLIDDLIRTAGLPCAPCGYPIADTALRWHPRIHVSGPLAELELGPAARTIAGARRSADRIVGALARAESGELQARASRPSQSDCE